ncbi:MAG: hypothetical protein ABI806_02055 [Candidatus Solibacter sp.]
MSQMIHIHYSNGRVLHGVVLAFGDRVVRIAVQDSDDAVEYRLVNHVWVSEDCEIVRMEFADEVYPVNSEVLDPLDPLVEFTAPLHAAPRVM